MIDHVLVSSVQQSESVTHISRTSLGAQMVKNLSAMQDTEVQSLGQREWQPTPAFLPGKSHGQRSLVGYSSWGHKESDTTEC